MDAPILIFGAPRSGTTWLAKIFDSHPDVLYRHEPDLVLQDMGLPWLCPPEPSEELHRMAAAYLDRLANTGTLKTAGVRPIFPKRYRDPFRHVLRSGLLWGLRGLNAFGVQPRRLDAARVPDLIANHDAPVRIVIKSVSAHGRARVFAEAAPTARIVVILRNPWGYVSSVRRGVKWGKFVSGAVLDWIPDSAPGRRHRLNRERLQAMSEVEQLAWHWTVLNEQLLHDLADRPNVRVLRYDELCEQPIRMARKTFAFTGLPWHQQTERFIAESSSFHGSESYYAVFRDAAQAPHRWRQELSPDEQECIAGVLRQTELARFCPTLEPSAVPG